MKSRAVRLKNWTVTAVTKAKNHLVVTDIPRSRETRWKSTGIGIRTGTASVIEIGTDIIVEIKAVTDRRKMINTRK